MLGTTRTKTNRPRTRWLPAVMTILLAATVSPFAQEMKVPETAKDHHEMAEHLPEGSSANSRRH